MNAPRRPQAAPSVLPFPRLDAANDTPSGAERAADWADLAADGCSLCEGGRTRCPCPSSCLLRDVDAQYRRIWRLWAYLMAAIALVAACAALLFWGDLVHAWQVLTAALPLGPRP